MLYKTLAIAVIVIVLLITGFLYVQNTPHYSLYQLKRAVDNHDADEALKYVNIDSVVENLGKSLFGKGNREAGKGEGKQSPLKGMLADAMPEIKESIKSSFRNSIADSDEVSKKKQRKNTIDKPARKSTSSIGGIEIGGLDAKKLKETSLWDIVVQRDGKTAEISLKNNPGMKARMVQTNGGFWQIVEIVLSY